MSTSQPRVSVLIPTYNRGDLLPSAIDSVLAQSYSNFEIVVVDDGSTDNTQEVLARYEGRVRYLYAEHAGPARARNIGMDAARGDYLCLLDSDDLYYPHKLALQVDHLDRYPDTVMVYTDFSAFNSQGFVDEFHMKVYHASAYRKPECAYDNLFTERWPLADNAVLSTAAKEQNSEHWLGRYQYRGQLLEAYLFDTIVFTNSMMFRRTVMKTIGPQRAYFGHFHDLEFALRLCKSGKVAFIDNPTYKLRYHPGQVSTTRGPDGELTAVALQRGLLRVARTHALAEGYYKRNSAKVDLLIARLCRAAALPMIAYGGRQAHLRRYLPRRARRYLNRSARHGHPAFGLYLVSFFPAFAKRVYFWLHDLWRRRRAFATGPAA